MQAKMATRNRLLNRLYGPFFSLWVPAFRWQARHVPLRLMYPQGALIMWLFLLLRPKYARAIRANFAQILGEPEDSKRVRAMTRRMAINHARYWIDFFYWSERGPGDDLIARTSLENFSALERCLAAGKGCILLTAHFGNWEMGGLLLSSYFRRSSTSPSPTGAPGHVPGAGTEGEVRPSFTPEVGVLYVPDRFERIEAHRSEYRRAAGLTEIPITEDVFSPLPALRILRDGGVIAVQGDRDFNNTGLPIRFFGRTAWFPRGPAVLSLLSGAPIVPIFILRCPDESAPGAGGFRVVVFDPIPPTGAPRDELSALAIVSRTVEAVERMVREHPDQWYCFYPFWQDPTRPDQAGRVAPIAAT